MTNFLAFWQRQTASQKTNILWAAVLALLAVGLYLGAHAHYGLFDVDEAIFTQATLEMRQNETVHGATGLAMPTYNGEPRYHKPPLVYWAQDVAMSALGENSLYAARLPSSLSALATIALVGFWVFSLTRNATWAVASSAVMAFNLSFLVVGRAATADGLLNISSFALAAWVSWLILTPKRPPWVSHSGWLVTGLLAAFGMLAKGPIAWFPAAFVALPLLIGNASPWVVWRALAPFRSFLVMLLALAPWLVLLVQQHGLGFFYEFIMVHNLGRYASGLSNTQSSSPFYYLGVLLAGFFPWVLLLPESMAAVLKPLLKPTRSQSDRLKPLKTLLAKPKAAKVLPFLCLVWAGVYIVFFSFSKTKLAHYIVPAYPALSVLVAWFWVVHMPSLKPEKRRLAIPTILAGTLLMLLFALVFAVLPQTLLGLRSPALHGGLGWLQAAVGFSWPPKDALAAAVLAQPVVLDPAPWIIAFLLAMGLLPAWWQSTFRKTTPTSPWSTWHLEGAFALVWGLCLTFIIWGVVPTVWGYTQAPLARLAARVATAPASVPLIHLGMHKPSVLYLSGKPFIKLEKALQLPDALTAPETWVLTPITKVPSLLTELEARKGAAILAQHCDGGYCLLTVAKLAKPE